MDIITDLMGAIDSIKAHSVAGIGALLMVLVRAYRLIPKAPWPSEEKSWIVFAALSGAGFLTALFVGVFSFNLSWPVAITTSLGIAVNAMGLHEATKAAAAAVMAPPAPEKQPSVWDKITGLFLPKPKAK